MKGKELIKWIEEEGLENGDVYVNGKSGYEDINFLWESESNGGATVIETKERKE